MDNDKRPLRVCLMGASFDTNNRGVSALASSLVRLVTDVLPQPSISFFMGHPERVTKTIKFAVKEVKIDVINYRLSPRAKLQEHIFCLLFFAFINHLLPSIQLREKILRMNSRLRDLYNCEFIGAINGGDSFSDIYGLWRFVESVLPMMITLLLGKRLVLLPQTYGPYQSPFARAIARWIIRRSATVLSRDHHSIPVIHSFIGNSNKNGKIEFCPDVAFTLPSLFPPSFAIYPPADVFAPGSLVGINVNGLLFHGGYTGANMFGLRFAYNDFILRLIEELVMRTSAKILLIPHTYGEKGNVNSDPEASRQLFAILKEHCNSRLHLLTGEYTECEIKGIIGRCHFFVGSRMHACIAAISQGVPTAAVAYSKKFQGVFESVGLEEMVIDARSLDLNKAIDLIIGLYRNRESETALIKQKIHSAKKEVIETFRDLLGTRLGAK